MADQDDIADFDQDLADEGMMHIELPAYEGPLFLLLELARAKKIDLTAISILDIADQFLAWFHRAKDMRIELAADWLVMAATLALLKSRMLIPVPKDERAAAEALLEDLATRLRRLDAVRLIADELLARRRIGTHWHRPIVSESDGPGRKHLDATLHALLSAYVREAAITMRPQQAPVRRPFLVLTVEDAIRHLQESDALTEEWQLLSRVVPKGRNVDAIHARSKVAASYVASLEMAKRGEVEIEPAPEQGMISVRRRREPV